MKCGHWLNAAAICITAICAAALADEPKPQPAVPPATEKVDKPDRPKVLVTISKETTYITEPLRPDGYVDYVKALNDHCSKGVTPENNAAVLFWKAVGPGPIETEKRGEFFKAIGVKTLPAAGDYFVSFDDYLRAKESAGGEPVDERLMTRAQEFIENPRPWADDDYPIVAAWLKRNEKPLDLFVSASDRSRWFEPVIVLNNKPPLFSAVIAPYGHIAVALKLHELKDIKSEHIAQAMDELLATHRVSRLLGSYPSVETLLSAAAMQHSACDGDQALLQSTPLTADQAKKLLAEIDKLPQLAKLTEIMERERFQFLGTAAYLSRSSAEQAAKSVGIDLSSKAGIEFAKSALDWDVALQLGNDWFDRIDSALQEPDRKTRTKKCNELSHELNELEKKSQGKLQVALELVANPKKAFPRQVGIKLLSMLMPAFERLPGIEERANMGLVVTRLGLAAAAYRADHRTYPTKLADLAPKYITAVPHDLFSDGELHYKVSGDGFVIYSVGPNGVDDGGKGIDDARNDESWDDIAFTVRSAGPPRPRD